MKEPKIRKIVTNLEEVFYEGGADMPVENGEKKSIKTVSVAAVIKNPYAGCIRVPAAGEILLDDENARAEIHLTEKEQQGETVR